jgi:hypothetical protein
MASDTYQIYAVKYAHHDRRAHENFLQGDPHDTAPMPLDYFVWAATAALFSTPGSMRRWRENADARSSRHPATASR